jgi:hypothetical protein
MPEQLADVLGVASRDLEQVTVVAGDVAELQDFGALRPAACETLLVAPGPARCGRR